jgi:mannose-6-phosphate isomerase
VTAALYPLTFQTLIRGYDYGDRRIAEHFQRDLPPGIVAETWELSDHPSNPGVVSNGPLAGRMLHSLIEELGPALMGTAIARTADRPFPLLLKFLDVARYLGVQIHPDDAFCAEAGFSDSGKSEAWHIVWAEPGATAYWGLKPGVTKADVAAAIDRLPPPQARPPRAQMTRSAVNATLASHPVLALMQPVPVQAGDTLYVPPGWIHACGPGVLMFEVQQNSDVTMAPQQLFAGGRTADAWTVSQAKELFLAQLVADDAPAGQEQIPPLSVEEGANERRYLLASRYFALEEWRVREPWSVLSHQEKFVALTTLEGQGTIEHSSGQEAYRPGSTIMIPAGMGPYRLVPHRPSRLLRSYVGDLQADIIAPLRSAGFPDTAIAALGGPRTANDLHALLGLGGR